MDRMKTFYSTRTAPVKPVASAHDGTDRLADADTKSKTSTPRAEAWSATMDLIIFHGDCPDGFCSAFIAKKRWPMAELLSAVHGQAISFDAVKDSDVIVVDFSWKRHDTEVVKRLASSLQILDHHKTAEDELAGLDYCTFDMARSGAQITWDFCFPNRPHPWYIDYVADRDLWQFKLPHSKEINAFIMALPHTIEAWGTLDKITIDGALAYGIGARMQVDHYVEKVCAQAYPGRWGDHGVLIVNAAYPNISDVCNALCERRTCPTCSGTSLVDLRPPLGDEEMCEDCGASGFKPGADIGLGWFVRSDGLMQFSLRSIGDFDISELAKMYGGGGHRNAAGFQVPVGDGFDLLDMLTHDPKP